MLTQSRLKEVLTYDPLTGIFAWAIDFRNGIRVGQIAGWDHPDGYLKITVDRKGYYAHRLAFLFVQGSFPNYVDHKNGNRKDNRFSNLRQASQFINSQNTRHARSDNVCGFMGVSLKRGKYQANIKHNNQVTYLGTFVTAEEAHQVYLRAKRELHQGCTI